MPFLERKRCVGGVPYTGIYIYTGKTRTAVRTVVVFLNVSPEGTRSSAARFRFVAGSQAE